MDKFRIDSHKLTYHVQRVHDWLNGKNIYPVYIEISPTGACNHRCIFCGLDFMEYKARSLDTALLKERLKELGELGVKSIMYAGEGEPFLHRDIVEIIQHTKNSGIDVAVTTNGVLFSKEKAENSLGYMEWIKIGIDAGTKETYAKIHRCREQDFDRLIENMKEAVRIKRKSGYSCAIGAQALLLPDNQKEMVGLAKLIKDIGLDYLVVKPYSQHPQSKTKQYSEIKYDDYGGLEEQLSQLKSDKFQVIVRIHTMRKWDDKKKEYECCLALPFWSYIDAGGNVWGCSVYLGDERFFYGNINEQSFKEIWESQKRVDSLRFVQEKLNASTCRVNCRMDEVNRYLWELKNPPDHVNFI
ncbi:MAG: radical SAM protein [Candidatus Omnitrophota bacterium]